MNFAKSLDAVMQERGYSKYKVAKILGVSQTTVANWLSGKTTPYIKEWDNIAFRLNIPKDELFDIDECNLNSTGNVKKEHANNGNLTAEAHHIGVLFDRADEKDRLLTHSVLDKYEEAGTITSISASSRNPGGFVELDVYDEPAAAGLGNYLDAPQARREQFPTIIVPKGATFGIRISGNSMEPMVADGSTVFVRQTMAVEPGRVGVFVLNGASFCKQLIVDRENMQVRLRSLNPDYQDIVVQPSDTLVTIGQVL